MVVDRRVVALGIARAADTMGDAFILIALPLYVAGESVMIASLTGIVLLGVTLTEEFYIGIALSLSGVLGSLLQPIAGSFSDRRQQRRALILVGLAIAAIGTALYPLLTDYVLLVLLRGVQGIGIALTVPCTVALVNEYSVSDEERGKNFAVFDAIRLLGFAFGAFIAGAVVQFGPYATAFGSVSGIVAAFLIAALLIAVAFGIIGVFIRDPENTGSNASMNVRETVRSIRDNRELVAIPVLAISFFLVSLSLSFYAPLEKPINERLGQGAFFFGIQFAASVVGTILLQVPAGVASDKFRRKPFILAGFLLVGPITAVQAFIVTPELMTVARFLQGASGALLGAPAVALAGDIVDEYSAGNAAGFLALLTSAFGLGLSVGPIIAGLVFSIAGYAAPFLATAVMCGVGFVLVYAVVDEP